MNWHLVHIIRDIPHRRFRPIKEVYRGLNPKVWEIVKKYILKLPNVKIMGRS